jgi:formate dehydrogenase subunit beta
MNKGIKLEGEIRKSILDFFEKTLSNNTFDAVLMPMMVPSEDSYAWILVKDKNLLKDAEPIVPIMPINAAKALKRYTRIGDGKFKIAALMKPCEIRATIELVKLNQIKLDDVTLFSYDCVGALPMQDFIAEPQKKGTLFDKLLKEQIYNSDETKPVCQICDKFSNCASDLHFAFENGNVVLISNSEKGDKTVTKMKFSPNIDLKNWQKNIDALATDKKKNRAETFELVKKMAEGFDNLSETFALCINCHNCSSVCPICYCRKCYFDSAVAKPNSDVKMMRAKQRGGIALPLDKIMFHTGRMAHMSLSCVSCGLCSDACPVNIPVAQIFSYVASQTQKTFDYVAGENAGDALPMKEYKLDEMGELGEMVKKAEVQESHNE